MTDALYEKLTKLPRKNLIALMWEALDYMQEWNGRTRTHCICKALGMPEGEALSPGPRGGIMSGPCLFCENYEYVPVDNTYRCAKAGWRHSDHGTFKRGCGCLHDPDLKDLFAPVSDIGQKVKELKDRVAKANGLLMDARDTITKQRTQIRKLTEMEETPE